MPNPLPQLKSTNSKAKCQEGVAVSAPSSPRGTAVEDATSTSDANVDGSDGNTSPGAAQEVGRPARKTIGTETLTAVSRIPLLLVRL